MQIYDVVHEKKNLAEIVTTKRKSVTLTPSSKTILDLRPSLSWYRMTILYIHLGRTNIASHRVKPSLVDQGRLTKTIPASPLPRYHQNSKKVRNMKDSPSMDYGTGSDQIASSSFVWEKGPLSLFLRVISQTELFKAARSLSDSTHGRRYPALRWDP